MINYDLVVIGGGPAGLQAAIEAKNNGIESILLIERDNELGGILNQCIHNGFGLHIFKEELTGPEYAERFINLLKEKNIDYKLNTFVINLSNEKIITTINEEDGILNIKGKAVILAMGCRERSRGNIALPGARPSGIFSAGTVQRFINIEGYMVGKSIVILGSGDIGLIMARRLTLEGAKVLAVVEIMPYCNGLNRNVVQCLNDYNIPLLLNHTVVDVIGKSRVEKVIVSEVDENRKPISGTEVGYECDTLLLSVGLIPENEISKLGSVNLDVNTNGPLVNNLNETNISGIFACGNVLHVHDVVDFVTKESKRAGRNAAKYILDKLNKNSEIINTVSGHGVRYIVPQKIDKNNLEEETTIYFRVNNKYKKSNIIIKSKDKIIKKIYKKYLIPSEMIELKLSKKDIETVKEISILIEEEN